MQYKNICIKFMKYIIFNILLLYLYAYFLNYILLNQLKPKSFRICNIKMPTYKFTDPFENQWKRPTL
jgi:hypothetical protein